MNTRAYLYKWTQISTGKWYVGSRAAKGCYPDDGYICSSKAVKPLIAEQPLDWVRTVLAIGHQQYIIDLERKYLQSLNAKNDPLSFNMHNVDGIFSQAGKTPWNKGLPSPYKNIPRSDEVKDKISRSHTGKPKNQTHIDNMSKSRLGKIPWNKGKTLSADIKERMSESAKNRKITDKRITAYKKLSEKMKGKLSPIKGKMMPAGHGEKISEYQKGRTKSKQVCRLFDKKEMHMSHYNQWINKQLKK